MLRTAFALLVLMLLASGAEAQKRVALVIGNSALPAHGEARQPEERRERHRRRAQASTASR